MVEFQKIISNNYNMNLRTRSKWHSHLRLVVLLAFLNLLDRVVGHLKDTSFEYEC